MPTTMHGHDDDIDRVEYRVTNASARRSGRVAAAARLKAHWVGATQIGRVAFRRMYGENSLVTLDQSKEGLQVCLEGVCPE